MRRPIGIATALAGIAAGALLAAGALGRLVPSWSTGQEQSQEEGNMTKPYQRLGINKLKLAPYRSGLAPRAS
jgi:hypothetical protein